MTADLTTDDPSPDMRAAVGRNDRRRSAAAGRCVACHREPALPGQVVGQGCVDAYVGAVHRRQQAQRRLPPLPEGGAA